MGKKDKKGGKKDKKGAKEKKDKNKKHKHDKHDHKKHEITHEKHPPIVEPEPEIPCGIECEVSETYVPDESCQNVECQANQYPAYLDKPKPMSVVGTESGSYLSICGLLNASQKCADRTLLMAPWGNFFVCKVLMTKKGAAERTIYFLYDGCTCNANSFRYLDLREGTAGFLTFSNVSSLVNYILASRYKREKMNLITKQVLDDICKEKRPTGEENPVSAAMKMQNSALFKPT